MSRKLFTLRVTKTGLDKIDGIARRAGVTRSAAIRAMLAAALFDDKTVARVKTELRGRF